MSPATTRMWSGRPIASVQLPDPVTALLRERERRFGDAAALAGLYAENAVLLDPNEPTWIRGQVAVANHVARAFRENYRVTPVAFEDHGSTATVAGYFTRGEGDAARHFAHVFLSLAQGSDGAWRIAAEAPVFKGLALLQPLGAAELIAQLEAAGIKRAVVLSLAYLYGDPRRQPADEYAQVRAENDWTREQIARYPDRLVGFCGLSPLRPYALEELERCVRQLRLSGLKLHFGNSGVDLRNADHIELIRKVFRAANEYRVPIVIHLRTRDPGYGRRDAEIFLKEILPAAPDIPIQVAHMGGAGPGYPPHADEALGVLAEAIAAQDRNTRNLYFDVTTVVTTGTSNATAALLVQRIRQVGVQRILFGADLATGAADGNPPPREAWGAFRAMLPLTEREFQAIAGNVAPYLR